jgi:universal stress protein A
MSNYSHILVAVDFSPSADTILKKARELAQRDDARLSLLHVVEYLPPIDTFGDTFTTINWEVDEEMLLDRAKESLQKLTVQHNLNNAETIVMFGTPKHEISQFVADHGCDLVMLGSHGRHGISLLLGSTANAVLHDMPCDVLTIKILE